MIRIKTLVGAGLLALVALVAAPAGAQYADVFSATISDTTVVPGQEVTISGVCEEADVVEVAVEGTSLGSIPVEADDSFSGQVTIPDLAPGTYTVTATCGSSVLGIEITVLGSDDGAAVPGGAAPGGAAPSTPSSSGGGDGTLARTGTSTDTLLKAGGGLLLAGAAVTLLVNKRRRAFA